MPICDVEVEVKDVMAALSLVNLPSDCELIPSSVITVKGDIDHSDIISAGYVDADDLPDKEEIAAQAIADLDVNLRDLRDGLRELIAGDRGMAATLIARALSNWPDAARVAEETLRGTTYHDRRQLTLLLA